MILDTITSSIIEKLRASSIISAPRYRVEVLSQNKPDILNVVDRALASIDGVLVVVGCDKAENFGSGITVDVSIACLENVAVNRMRDDHKSALDIAMECVKALDGETYHWMNLTHEVVDSSVLQATLTFRVIADKKGN